MSHEFELAELRNILANCREYESGHHLGRPFMSAYQIAIRFAETYLNHQQVRDLPLGGKGTGEHRSLAQRIARFLSQAIKNGEAGDIEGGFISHDLIGDLYFRNTNDRKVKVSNLESATAHSIFRVAE